MFLMTPNKTFSLKYNSNCFQVCRLDITERDFQEEHQKQTKRLKSEKANKTKDARR